MSLGVWLSTVPVWESHFDLLRCHREGLLPFWHIKCAPVLLNCMAHNVGIAFNMKPTMKWNITLLCCSCSNTFPNKGYITTRHRCGTMFKLDFIICRQSPVNVGLGVIPYHVPWNGWVPYKHINNAMQCSGKTQEYWITRYICGITFEHVIFLLVILSVCWNIKILGSPQPPPNVSLSPLYHPHVL